MEDRQGPIERFIAESPRRLKPIIVNDPPLALSVQVTDKDMSAQPLVRSWIVQRYGNSLWINTGAMPEYIPQGDRVWKAVTERHFAGNPGIGRDQPRISQREGAGFKGRKAQEQKCR